jgi:hypothetical protein
MDYPILQPAITLVLWSLVMLAWMIAVRIPALRAANIPLDVVGGRGINLDGVVPDRAQWPSHNYNHLMEQPTLFYITIAAIALAAPTDTVSIWLAWAYVGLRIAHSVYQATRNVVAIRFSLFALSSVALIGLAARAAVLVF